MRTKPRDTKSLFILRFVGFYQKMAPNVGCVFFYLEPLTVAENFKGVLKFGSIISVFDENIVTNHFYYRLNKLKDFDHTILNPGLLHNIAQIDAYTGQCYRRNSKGFPTLSLFLIYLLYLQIASEISVKTFT